MAGLSKVIVLDPDLRAGRQVQLGFEREGVRAVAHPVPDVVALLELETEELGLVVIGGGEESLELVRVTREILDTKGLDVPILFAGRVARRSDVETAGADEVVSRPAYLRDVVTIGRLLNGIPAEQRLHIIGNLGELTNVFTLVRALAALGRSATLTLMRGLRRGEIRFFHGEVTSAQVGLIHGQAALHQLLLWTDARFDFHHEDVVRRQQIPLTHDELFADAERFLAGIQESSGPLSPSMVLEQDIQRVHSLGKQIPTEVHGVLRMFDGHRVLADVLEDSPYRVFETLRVAQRALEAGLLRVVQSQRPKATWRAVLSIEEWLVGADRDGVVDRGAPEIESGPVSGPTSGPVGRDSKSKLPGKKQRRNRKARRANTPLPIAAQPPIAKTIDWGALVPRVIGADVGSLAGVVPAAQRSGEIQLPSREIEREKLESLMDTGKRDRIFPSDIGLEPSVVFDDSSEPRGNGDASVPELAKPRTVTGQIRDDRQSQVKQLVKKHQTERTVAALDARSRRELEARSAGDSKNREQLEAQIRARQESEEAEAVKQARKEAEAWAAEARALEETKAREAEAAAREAAARTRAAEDAARKAEADRAEAEAAARKVEADRAEAEAARRTAEAKALADAIAGTPSTAADRAAADARVIADVRPNYASDLVRALVSEVKTPPVTVAETSTATVTMQDTMTVTAGAETAVLRATPTVTVGEAAPIAELVDVESHPLAAIPIAEQKAYKSGPVAVSKSGPVVVPKPEPEPKPAPVVDAKPAPVAEPAKSDESARPHHIATAETVPLGRRAEREVEPVIVEDLDADRPKDTGGELASRNPVRTTMEPIEREPSILVQDLAADAATIAAAATAPAAVNDAKSGRTKSKSGKSERVRAKTNPPIERTKSKTKPPTGSNVSVEGKARPSSQNLATPEREKVVAEVRKDAAVAFSDAEEAFFASASEDETGRPALIAAENFDDLDEGYQPVGFWERVFGRKKPASVDTGKFPKKK